ncbi:MAG TPA: hypothetical protein VG758_01530 [Hyphomicrobiaceae bacterium]|jgi:hypothetical protein|nr:hypothetical protein [Hyphomicrobiaceae bacterium]
MLTDVKSIRALALAMATVAGAAFSGAAYAASPSVTVTDQKLVRNSVTIADVNLPKNGFVAIHASDAGGKMTSRIVGYAALRAGDHKGVRVHLTGTQKAGETLWAVAHQAKGRYLFGNRSRSNIGTPFMQDGKTVDEAFKTL